MAEETKDQTITIAGVRFRENWKVYDFDASGVSVVIGDRVIVDSDRGLGFASVVRIRRAQPVNLSDQPPAPAVKLADVPEGVEIDIDGEPGPSETGAPEKSRGAKTIRKVVRKATEDDLAREEKNREREAQAFSLAQDMITERELPMKLIRVEYAFDGSRATFFFFSENRIDFRDLVKDLAFKLKNRIEMRQIGVRDVARMIGGFGPCGRELCCSSFLKNFEPVSIRMAKKQEMVLNPAKISGVCGRLLCCLSYEYEMFEANKKDLADMRQSAIKEKREEEERRVAAERKDAEEQRQEEEKTRQADQRRQQEQRRDRQKESGQKSGIRQDKKKDQQEKKAQPGPAEQRQRQQQRPERAEKRERPEKPQRPERPRQPQDQSGEQAAAEQQPQQPLQPQQEGEKTGRKKRRRFWRKKKKPGQGDGKAPQGDGGGQGAA
jgi:cell fate regulator YaaT (PSP1 superfamily)